jgi:fibronectin-binding autotransporter adhesin
MGASQLKSSKLKFWDQRSKVGTVTGGNEIQTVGSYKYHIFTSDGTLSITGAKDIEITACAGGGAGGAKGHAGGGGAGELRIWTPVTSATGTYSITIGSGGTGSTDQTNPGQSGGNTVFGSVFTVLGGGGGGSRQQVAPTAGAAGGSGGGGNTYSTELDNGGAANGFNTNKGGRGGSYTDPYYSSGGGGGAVTAGGIRSLGSTVIGGAGGEGYTLTNIDPNLTSANFTSFSGMTVICSGGGGSAYLASGSTTVSGGTGGTGAGNGGYSNSGGGYSANATNAVSFGSGGGGGQFNGNASGSNGKSGVVIVRYLP